LVGSLFATMFATAQSVQLITVQIIDDTKSNAGRFYGTVTSETKNLKGVDFGSFAKIPVFKGSATLIFVTTTGDNLTLRAHFFSWDDTSEPRTPIDCFTHYLPANALFFLHLYQNTDGGFGCKLDI